PFCLGLGAVIGEGRQPFPWIHVDDMVGILLHLIDHPEIQGRYNAVAPAKRLKRPVLWHVPAWLVRAIVGAERSSILLEGQLVRPKRTLAAGYRFRYPTIGPA